MMTGAILVRFSARRPSVEVRAVESVASCALKHCSKDGRSPVGYSLGTSLRNKNKQVGLSKDERADEHQTDATSVTIT